MSKRRGRGLDLAALSAFAVIGFATSAAGQTADSVLANARASNGLPPVYPTRTFPAWGDRGDAQVEDRCGPGKFIVGLKYRAGDWFDQVQMTCASVALNGALLNFVDGVPRGGAGGGPGAVVCPPGRVVSGLDMQMTQRNREVARIVLRCEGTVDHAFSPLPASGPSPKTAGAAPPQYCTPGSAAIGLTVHYGKHVNALGLVCGGPLFGRR